MLKIPFNFERYFIFIFHNSTYCTSISICYYFNYSNIQSQQFDIHMRDTIQIKINILSQIEQFDNTV